MNYTQLQTKAQAECADLQDDQFLKIRFAASTANRNANASFNILVDWAGQAKDKIKVTRTGSFGYGDLEPIMMIEKPGKTSICFAQITESVIQELICDYLEGDIARPDLALDMTSPLFTKQKRIVLRNCGIVDPEDLNAYIADCQGYMGLAKALSLKQDVLIEEIRRSGLKNRADSVSGVAEEWKAVLEDRTSEKVVVCNALDMDLEARKTRLLLEGDPHSVLEGLLIAAYGVGATQALIAIPKNCGHVKERLAKALAQLKDYGLIGEGILDSEFNCSFEVKECNLTMTAGEKTSLLRALEGRQAIPYLPLDKQETLKLKEKAALVIDIETLANVSAILQQSAEWFAQIGTSESPGTKVISLSGTVLHPYTVEVPYGTTLHSLIGKIGGGVPAGNKMKAVQFGGPSSAYFGVDDLNKPIDDETAREAGALMGVGLLEVIADTACIVEKTEQLMTLLHEQTCGKCVYCREGTLHLANILKDIVGGQGTTKDLEMLMELSEKMAAGSICNFGKSAANPVLSSLRLFAADYDYHLKHKKCPVLQGGKGE